MSCGTAVMQEIAGLTKQCRCELAMSNIRIARLSDRFVHVLPSLWYFRTGRLATLASTACTMALYHSTFALEFWSTRAKFAPFQTHSVQSCSLVGGPIRYLTSFDRHHQSLVLSTPSTVSGTVSTAGIVPLQVDISASTAWAVRHAEGLFKNLVCCPLIVSDHAPCT